MILIGLGANLDGPLGTPIETLKASISSLEMHGIMVVKGSNIWRTSPVPASDQPWYYNAVCTVETSLSAPHILAIFKEIERKFGREAEILNASRVIDLDLLSYNDEPYEGKNLILPHPRMHERGFVLNPLAEVVPLWVHPVLKINIPAMLKSLPRGQNVIRLEDRILP